MGSARRRVDLDRQQEMQANAASPALARGTGAASSRDARDVTAHISSRVRAAAFDLAPVAMSIVDLEGKWLDVNGAYTRLLGYDRSDLAAINSRTLTHSADLDEDLEWALRVAAGEAGVFERERRCIARDGSTVWVSARSEVIRDGGQPPVILSALWNITERHDVGDAAAPTSERSLRAIVDSSPEPAFVQGLDWRYMLVNQAFEQQIGRDRRDILGRRDDEVLPPEAVAANREGIERVLRTGELVRQEDTVEVGGKCRHYATVKFPLLGENDEIYAVCSTFSDITERKEQEDALRERLKWTDLIHGAVTESRLVLHAQPILNLASGEIEQAELLVRMRGREVAALIPPGDFIPAAERFGLIGVIDRWVLCQAFDLAKDHRVQINLSGATISDPDQVAELESLVRDSKVPPENIIFEITESAAAEHMESARDFAIRLRKLGCAFALDDFGIGYGAFTYLKHLPVDYLKIDIAFVRDLVGDDDGRQVVHAIISVGTSASRPSPRA